MRIGPIARYGAVAAAIAAGPTVTLAVPTVDGMDIPSDFGPAVATQRFQTNFGNDESGNQFGNGSELNALHITNDADYLYIGIPGNLENNGNGMAIFLDVDEGASGASLLFTKDIFGDGSTVEGLPRFFGGDNGGGVGYNDVTFDNGFAPNIMMGLSGGSPLGSQTLTYYLVNWVVLGDSVGGVTPDSINHQTTVLGLMVAGDSDAHGADGTLSTFWPDSDNLGILASADNSNVLGVDGGNGLWTTDPATATTGFEFAIPLSLLGLGVGDDISAFAIVGGDNGFLSNQLLPTNDTDSTFDNLGNDRPLDFNGIAGSQFVAYTIVEVDDCPEDLNGDGTINLSDLGILLASFEVDDGGDINGDGVTDLADLGALLAVFGFDC
jgi:hypothetical protein